MADGQHEENIDRDGHKDTHDHLSTKDVNDSSGGRHDKEDRGGK